MRNRTINFELKYDLGEIGCKFKSKDNKPMAGKMKIVVDQQDNEDEDDYSDDESYEERPKPTNLLQLTKRELPCPQQFRENVENPSMREFISSKIGNWIGNSAKRNNDVNSMLLIIFTLNLLCTTLAFIH